MIAVISAWHPVLCQYPLSRDRAGEFACPSGLVLLWTRFPVGFIGDLALYVQYSLFTNEYYGIIIDAYSLDPALISTSPAR